MKRLLTALTLLALLTVLATGQESPAPLPESPYWAMFWNVANLFDAVDDPETEGRDRSDPEELEERLRRMRAIVSRVDWGRGPDLLLLAEVENAKLIEAVAGEGYEIVFDQGRDTRGLNVGMATRFPVVKSEYLDPKTTGRTILHAELRVGTEERLHVYALHFKSKYNRATATLETRADEETRAVEAAFLQGQIDKLFEADPAANVLIMGDFNEEHRDSLFRRELITREFRRGDDPPNLEDDDRRLLNLGESLQQSYPGGGTTYYHPHWNIFDNILISEALALPGGLSTTAKEAHIAVHWDLLNNYGTPAHFIAKYPTCVSDHLPVVLRFRRGE
jgi:hypothetical protein